ncbi:Uma2 family endonuclease [Streptomyces sp. NPDC012935]|uniref:Uma2 family endonuclease n=1 Tax=Streptomyces sp. NPDC012935 TaxID=3364857 RepID=UPI0036C46B88
MNSLHAQLARLEDAFPGFRTEIVEGNVVAYPVRPFDGGTVRAIWAAVEPQVAPDWALVSDVVFPFDEGNEFCPDLAAIPAAAAARNRSAYSPDLIEFVAEVVSPESSRRDYELKPAGTPTEASPTTWSSTR